MNAPFSQHCKNGTDNPQDHTKTRRKKDETASDNRICRLCFCTFTKHVGFGYARSNALYVEQSRWGSHSGQRRPWARTRAWVGPSRRSRPPLWLAPPSPLVVNREKERGRISWRPLATRCYWHVTSFRGAAKLGRYGKSGTAAISVYENARRQTCCVPL
jgi:hypothetical protein